LNTRATSEGAHGSRSTFDTLASRELGIHAKLPAPVVESSAQPGPVANVNVIKPNACSKDQRQAGMFQERVTAYPALLSVPSTASQLILVAPW
jgi:hypothetical protein